MAESDKSGVPGFDPTKFKVEISVDDDHLDYDKQGLRSSGNNFHTSGNSPKVSQPGLLAGQGTQGSQFNKPQIQIEISPEGNGSKVIDFHDVPLENGSHIASPPNHDGVNLRINGFGGISRKGYDLSSNYERASAETRALLDIEQSKFEVTLQRLYATKNCHYFYVFILVTTLILVLVTVFKGFKIDENPLFLIVESILNFMIVLDFICRVKIAGLQRFFFGTGRVWNCLDAFFVTSSLLIFIIILASNSTTDRPEGQHYLSNASEIVMLVFWSLFQTARVIFIAKRQRLAQLSAKTLIDFTHNIIVVETEANNDVNHGLNSDRLRDKSSQGGYSKHADEVIVFDMKKIDQKPIKGVANHHRILVKEGSHIKGGRRKQSMRLPDAEVMQSESGVISQGTGMDTIEMQDLSSRNENSNKGPQLIPQQQEQSKRIINIAFDDEEEGNEDEI